VDSLVSWTFSENFARNAKKHLTNLSISFIEKIFNSDVPKTKDKFMSPFADILKKKLDFPERSDNCLSVERYAPAL